MNYAEKNEILSDFEKLINFYARKSVSYFDDMRGCLLLFLLELYARGKCVSKRYVAVAIRNEYIRISKFIFLHKTEREFVDFCLTYDIFPDEENKMLFADILKSLTQKQRECVLLRFYGGYSSTEIAERFGISRQAVHRLQKRALDKLREVM